MGGVLEWDDVTVTEVQLIVLKTSVKNLSFVTIADNACSLGVKDVAPLALREEVGVLFGVPVDVR